MKQLIESGEKERLMELLRERLVECGWKDEMKAICRWDFASALISASPFSFLPQITIYLMVKF